MSIAVGLGVALVLVALLVARTIVVVPADHVAVVERLGRVARTLPSGLHVLLPLIDRVRARLPTGETARPLPPTTCITADNRTIDVEGTLRVRIVDATSAMTAVADYEAACVQAAATVLREEVATRRHEDVRESSRDVAARVVERLGAITAAWGIHVTGCDLSITR